MGPMPVPVNVNGPTMRRVMPAPMVIATVVVNTFRPQLI